MLPAIVPYPGAFPPTLFFFIIQVKTARHKKCLSSHNNFLNSKLKLILLLSLSRVWVFVFFRALLILFYLYIILNSNSFGVNISGKRWIVPASISKIRRTQSQWRSILVVPRQRFKPCQRCRSWKNSSLPPRKTFRNDFKISKL